MFTTYKVPLTLHILAADVSVVGMRTFIPASLVLIGTGLWLVHEGSWGYGKAWVLIGLAVWIGSFLSGALFLGPQSGKLAKDIEAYGFSSPQAQSRLSTIFLHSRIELAFLLIVVCDMVLKPGA